MEKKIALKYIQDGTQHLTNSLLIEKKKTNKKTMTTKGWREYNLIKFH
jgi:hypothetical protein